MEKLEDALKKKDEDMKQMEERYKKYLEKAKSVSVFIGLSLARCIVTREACCGCQQESVM